MFQKDETTYSDKRAIAHWDNGQGTVNVEVLFEPRDLWIGCYWNFTKSIESKFRRLDIYICVLPLLPIHLKFEWGWK